MSDEAQVYEFGNPLDQARVDRALGERDAARRAMRDLANQLVAGIAIHKDECHLKDQCPWVLMSRRVLAEWDA